MNEFDKIWNETMGCGACDVKPSEDCISRQAVIQIIENKLNPCTDMFKCLEMSEIKEDVEHLPSVTPKAKVGHWVYTPKRRLIDETDEGCVYITDYRCTCSECGGDFGFQKMSDAYCKYCGSYNGGREDES